METKYDAGCHWHGEWKGVCHPAANPGILFDNDPDGLLPKMLSRMIEANNCTIYAAQGALKEAWEEWHERT